MKIPHYEINAKGFSHLLTPIFVVILIGAIGFFTLRASHAVTVTSQTINSGPYLTLLFSRSEMGAADNCTPSNTNVEPLYTTDDSPSVASYLQSIGLKATGSLVTGTPNMLTTPSTEGCVHYGDSITSDWQDASALANTYGWSFISHTSTYPTPKQFSRMTSKQQFAETCGSAAAIASHNLPGAYGMIAYPGAQAPPTSIQENDSATCIDWGRTYGGKPKGITTVATPPYYWQNTVAVHGGPCNDSTQACYTITAQGSQRYSLPSTIVSQIQALQPGQWFTLQAYLLATGTNPTYSQNQTKWDCTSSNPNEHWTNDVERYCYSDYQTIVNAIAAYNQNAQANGTTPITVTDPHTVGMAAGRPY